MNLFCISSVIVLFCLQQADLFCINILSEDEKPCARPLNLDADSVLDFYQTNSQSPVFAEYLNCIWLARNFVNKDGTISYENIKASKSLPWEISHFCEDVITLTRKAQQEYKQAAIYCENNPPAAATPLTVRQCIVDNYKPIPIEDYLKTNPYLD